MDWTPHYTHTYRQTDIQTDEQTKRGVMDKYNRHTHTSTVM